MRDPSIFMATTIEIIPDNYAGQPKVTVDGSKHVRVIEEKE